MAVRNPTQWSPPSGEGYISQSTGAFLTTQSGITLETQSGIDLIISEDTYQPKFDTSWTLSTKETTSWRPPSGEGYVITEGNLQLVTNGGDSLVTNSGDNLVTNPTYDTNKNPTDWTESGT